MPTYELAETELGDGMNVIDLMVLSGLVPSKGEGRRVIQQGGLSIDGEKVTDIAQMVTKDIFKDGIIVIKKGKKVFIKVQLV